MPTDFSDLTDCEETFQTIAKQSEKAKLTHF